VFNHFRKLTYDRDSIVILAFHKLGDTVFTIPAIKNIINIHKAKVFIFCHPESKEIFELAIIGVEYCTFPQNAFFYNKMISKRVVRSKLNKINPDTIYDFTGSIKSASIIFNSKAAEKIGTNKLIYRSLYTKFTPLRIEPHCIDIYMDVVRLNTIDIKYERTFKKLLNINQRIVLHPFAGWPAKEWSLRKYIRLAELLSSEFNCEILIQGSRIMSADILREIKLLNINLFICNTVNDMIERIRNAFYFIGNDSGPVHIANLLGVPTFTIYGPTNPVYHKPLVGMNSYIQKKIICSPNPQQKICFTSGGRFGCPAFNCLDTLSVKEVYNSIKKHIELITV